MMGAQNFDSLLDMSPASKDVAVPSKTPAPSGFRVLDGAGNQINMIAGDAYEGASNRSRELALWTPASRSADADIIPQKKMSDARVRDTLRNDSYVKAGSTLHQDNIVGAMYLLNAKPATKLLLGKEDETWEEEFQEETEALFTLGVESDDCWIDSGRRNDFTSQIRLGVSTYLATGEILALVDWARDDAARRPFNTSIRMVDLDRLSTPMNQLTNPYIIGGVEVDKRHIPLAYHIRKGHPSDYFNPDAYMWERVEARKPWGRRQVIHIFEQERSAQTRGISAMVSALKEMRQTKDFRDIVLQNAVVNATYAATIEADMPSAEAFARLGGGDGGDIDLVSGSVDYMTGYLGAVNEYLKNSNNLQLGGVRIPHLPPGSKLKLNGAGEGGPLGTDFEKSLLRYIAAILGVSYEQLSHDYSETNYSSARAAMSETWKFMLSRKRMVADKMATSIYRLWLEEMLNRGKITSMPRNMLSSMDWYYAPLGADMISNCEWIGAGRGQIDELKETQASILRLKYNISTLEQESARFGTDWRMLIKQKKREKKKLDEAGLMPEEANAMNAASGSKSANEAKPQKSDGSSKKVKGELNGTLDNDFFDAEHEDDDRGQE